MVRGNELQFTECLLCARHQCRTWHISSHLVLQCCPHLQVSIEDPGYPSVMKILLRPRTLLPSFPVISLHPWWARVFPQAPWHGVGTFCAHDICRGENWALGHGHLDPTPSSARMPASALVPPPLDLSVPTCNLETTKVPISEGSWARGTSYHVGKA